MEKATKVCHPKNVETIEAMIIVAIVKLKSKKKMMKDQIKENGIRVPKNPILEP